MNTQAPLNLLRDSVLQEVPRVLGLGDRDQHSPTFGCFDRAYWHYATSDFPNARFQEAAHLLALLFVHPFPGNIYHGRSAVRQWAKAALRFWAARRNADGSVWEAYPYERSFCATSFTAFAATETVLLLGCDTPPNFEATACWLAGHGSPTVANQMAAAALALCNFHRLTGQERYGEAAREKIASLLRVQDSTGFFPEYGGYDIGYQSITLGLLALYRKASGDDDLTAPLTRAADFLDRHVGSDGRFSIDGTSRRTQFLYPLGLSLLGSPALDRFLSGRAADRVMHPGWMDDRYVIPLCIDTLQTYIEVRP